MRPLGALFAVAKGGTRMWTAAIALAALVVGSVASGCEVRADVRSFSKDEFNVLHIVFAIDARCDGDYGCSGEFAYEVFRRGNGRESKGTGTALWSASQTFTVNQSAGSASYAYSYWVPVASHNPGKASSQWRNDLGLLNTGAVAANVQISFYGNGTVVSNTTSVAAKSQSILVDVVNQIPSSNSGALQIQSDQPLKVTARSYSLISSTASCLANGTQGQGYPAVATGDGLSAPQSAYLGGLSENPPLRCNIGVVNTGAAAATVLVELFNGVGTKLAEYPVTLNPGDWKQETEPFFSKAAQSAMDRGYAKITVQTGSGVFGFASVVDGLTNDPTTVAMQR